MYPAERHACAQSYYAHAAQGVKVMFVAAGSGACHSIIGDAAGKCYTWGRNEACF